MLGKLTIEEMKSYRFSFGITFLAGFIFTVFMKIIVMLPYQDDLKELIGSISFMAYQYVIALVGGAALVLIIVRFYSTMVADQGYLTWTLPAKSSTILWAKLIGGGIWRIIALIVTVILALIFYFGNDILEMDYMYQELMDVFVELLGQFKIAYILPILQGCLLAFVWSFIPLVIIYMCIAIGQLFGKWRVIASIGCYFILTIIFEILAVATVVGVVMVGEAGADTFMVAIEQFFENASPYFSINIVLFIANIASMGIFAAFFAITNSIFKKKLNLE